jgi:predicted RNA methylase
VKRTSEIVMVIALIGDANDIVYDLGCGDGRIVITAAERYGARVVSHNYHMPGWNDKKVCVESLKDEFGKEHTIFVYRP